MAESQIQRIAVVPIALAVCLQIHLLHLPLQIGVFQIHNPVAGRRVRCARMVTHSFGPNHCVFSLHIPYNLRNPVALSISLMC